MLADINQRVMIAAAPWCGRLVELDAQGERRCMVRVKTLSIEGLNNALEIIGGVLVTDELLSRLEPAELAMVLGHEIAHVVLGHTMARVRRLSPKTPADVMTVLESETLAPRHDTPVDRRRQELDADALGLYIGGLAGYPVGAAAELVRAATIADAGEHSATHPSHRQRVLQAQARARAFCLALREGKLAVPAESRLRPEAAYRRELVASLQRRLDVGRVCVDVP